MCGLDCHALKLAFFLSAIGRQENFQTKSENSVQPTAKPFQVLKNRADIRSCFNRNREREGKMEGKWAMVFVAVDHVDFETFNILTFH